MNFSTAIGIDIGTAVSRVAAVQNGCASLIQNRLRKIETPSFVTIQGSDIIVGDLAKQQAILNQTHTIYHIKRLIGRKADDPLVESEQEHLDFHLTSVNTRLIVPVKFGQSDHITFEELMALLICELKKDAERKLKLEVKQAVITVPVAFNSQQRQAVLDAAKIANLQVLRLVNETTAAAIAYSTEMSHREEEDVVVQLGQRTVLIFDLGAGSLDVSVVTVSENGRRFEVKAAAGDTTLGGTNFTQKLVDFLADEFSTKQGEELRKHPKAIRRLKEVCNITREKLSLEENCLIEIPKIIKDIDYEVSVTRHMLDIVCTSLYKQVESIIELVLSRINNPQDVISDILLTGGASQIPALRKILQYRLPNKQLNVCVHAAVRGAALLAESLASNNESLTCNLPVVANKPEFAASKGIEKKTGFLKVSKEGNLAILKVFSGTNHALAGTYRINSLKVENKNIDIPFSINQNSRISLNNPNHDTEVMERLIQTYAPEIVANKSSVNTNSGYQGIHQMILHIMNKDSKNLDSIYNKSAEKSTEKVNMSPVKKLEVIDIVSTPVKLQRADFKFNIIIPVGKPLPAAAKMSLKYILRYQKRINALVFEGTDIIGELSKQINEALDVVFTVNEDGMLIVSPLKLPNFKKILKYCDQLSWTEISMMSKEIKRYWKNENRKELLKTTQARLERLVYSIISREDVNDLQACELVLIKLSQDSPPSLRECLRLKQMLHDSYNQKDKVTIESTKINLN